jgi:uncharacterized protein YgiM (DUF1202 family)
VNTVAIKVLKGAVGVLILVVLLMTVSRWWADYRDSAAESRGSVPATEAAPPQGEGGDSSGSKSDQAEAKSASDAEKPEKVVVVLTDGLNFREQPDSDSNEIRALDKGDKLVYIKKQGNWYQVEDDDGTRGWVSARADYSKVQ